MTLTLAQRKFFIDPIQDPLAEAKSILVLEERYGRGVYANKITDVRSITTYNNRVWWVSDVGDYVAGAPLNPVNLAYGTEIMGILSDDLFVIGTYNGVRSDSRGLNINRSIRSDQMVLPSVSTDVTVTAKTWVLAAPWARELMPLPTDNAAVTNAKLALAEQRWDQRRAKAVILQEALYRDWWDDMEGLAENHDMLEPRLGGLFSGGVLIKVAAATPTDGLTDTQREELKAKTDRALSAGAFSSTYSQTQMTLPVRVTVTKPDELGDVDRGSVVNQVRNAIGDYYAVVGDYTLSPVLRSAA
jgi:hypothetical protein